MQPLRHRTRRPPGTRAASCPQAYARPRVERGCFVAGGVLSGRARVGSSRDRTGNLRPPARIPRDSPSFVRSAVSVFSGAGLVWAVAAFHRDASCSRIAIVRVALVELLGLWSFVPRDNGRAPATTKAEATGGAQRRSGRIRDSSARGTSLGLAEILGGAFGDRHDPLAERFSRYFVSPWMSWTRL